jgi:ankyrin repeat protein
LLNAAGNGRSADTVRLLLENGAEVNFKSGETAEVVKNSPILIGRVTPLHQAAAQGDAESVAGSAQCRRRRQCQGRAQRPTSRLGGGD